MARRKISKEHWINANSDIRNWYDKPIFRGSRNLDPATVRDQPTVNNDPRSIDFRNMTKLQTLRKKAVPATRYTEDPEYEYFLAENDQPYVPTEEEYQEVFTNRPKYDSQMAYDRDAGSGSWFARQLGKSVGYKGSDRAALYTGKIPIKQVYRVRRDFQSKLDPNRERRGDVKSIDDRYYSAQDVDATVFDETEPEGDRPVNVIRESSYLPTLLPEDEAKAKGAPEKAAVVLIDKRTGKFVAAKPTGSDGYDVFGGSIEPGETPRQAALRELREEAGIQLEPNNLKYLGRGIRRNNFREYYGPITDYYLAEVDVDPEGLFTESLIGLRNGVATRKTGQPEMYGHALIEPADFLWKTQKDLIPFMDEIEQQAIATSGREYGWASPVPEQFWTKTGPIADANTYFGTAALNKVLATLHIPSISRSSIIDIRQTESMAALRGYPSDTREEYIRKDLRKQGFTGKALDAEVRRVIAQGKQIGGLSGGYNPGVASAETHVINAAVVPFDLSACVFAIPANTGVLSEEQIEYLNKINMESGMPSYESHEKLDYAYRPGLKRPSSADTITNYIFELAYLFNSDWLGPAAKDELTRQWKTVPNVVTKQGKRVLSAPEVEAIRYSLLEKYPDLPEGRLKASDYGLSEEEIGGPELPTPEEAEANRLQMMKEHDLAQFKLHPKNLPKPINDAFSRGAAAKIAANKPLELPELLQLYDNKALTQHKEWTIDDWTGKEYADYLEAPPDTAWPDLSLNPQQISTNPLISKQLFKQAKAAYAPIIANSGLSNSEGQRVLRDALTRAALFRLIEQTGPKLSAFQFYKSLGFTGDLGKHYFKNMAMILCLGSPALVAHITEGYNRLKASILKNTGVWSSFMEKGLEFLSTMAQTDPDELLGIVEDNTYEEIREYLERPTKATLNPPQPKTRLLVELQKRILQDLI